NGAHVQAGDVLGFMGNTGDAEWTPYHLHFEIHPVSMLFIGYDGAVDPQTYLEAWQKLEDVNFPVGGAWAPLIHGHGGAPEPGAILLQVSDISQADGLDPASLRRALVAERSG
ncbi:MAG: M23 family metallopeptidase, partial [Gaiellaceae bacterium]